MSKPDLPSEVKPSLSKDAVDDAQITVELDADANGEPSPVLELLARLKPGLRVDDKYDVQGVIGRGGMGVVVSARHVDLGRTVALKFLCSTASTTSNREELRARFRREAQISATLRNEHITRVLDVGTFASAAYIVMEHLDGGDLRQKMQDAGGRLPVHVALNYILQLCEGIAEAHALGIVHRDLKPSNLFIVLAPDGSDLLKILDFGISKWNEPELSELTEAGMILGSPKYMAPEQMFGSATIDSRADIWSIGTIFYQMVAGRTPYVQTTLPRLCQEIMSGPPPRLDTLVEVPKGIADVIARCFSRKPEGRVAHVAELAGALLDALNEPAHSMRERLNAIMNSAGGRVAAPSSRKLLRSASNSEFTNLPLSVPAPTQLSSVVTAGVQAPAASSRLGIITLGFAAVLAVVSGVVAVVVSRRPAVGTVGAAASQVTASIQSPLLEPAFGTVAPPPVTGAAPAQATTARASSLASGVATSKPSSGLPGKTPLARNVAAVLNAAAATASSPTTPIRGKNDDEIPTMR
jgi:serine/threonine protein kinase